MDHTRFERLPVQAFVTLGDYTWVRPADWDSYLGKTLRRQFPLYTLKKALRRGHGSAWQENDCIFRSLVQYLLAQFGILAPENSLFQVYNPDGAGLLPGQILTAIRSVIEPLGLELERVLVPDTELRLGLGYPAQVTDLGGAQEFAGRAGLCMINIRAGFSHAFYWNEMEPDRFTQEKFRMALLVRQPGRLTPPASPSATRCLADFCRLLSAGLPPGESAAGLQAEILRLAQFVQDHEDRQSDAFRSQVDQGLGAILASYPPAPAQPNRSRSTQPSGLAEAGQMVRRIFREAASIA